MKNLAIIGAFIGAGLLLMGYLARSPGQEALSTAVMVMGVAIILFVIVLAAIARNSNDRRS